MSLLTVRMSHRLVAHLYWIDCWLLVIVAKVLLPHQLLLSTSSNNYVEVITHKEVGDKNNFDIQTTYHANFQVVTPCFTVTERCLTTDTSLAFHDVLTVDVCVCHPGLAFTAAFLLKIKSQGTFHQIR